VRYMMVMKINFLTTAATATAESAHASGSRQQCSIEYYTPYDNFVQ
jgi:hypothetical protein